METQHDKLSPSELMADALTDGDGHLMDTPAMRLRARYSIRPTIDGRQMLERIAP